MGSTQHPSRVRASDAQMLPPPGVGVRGERSLHHVRGQPRKDGGKELEPPAAALRSERWVANESLRRCVRDDVGNRMPSGMRTDAVDLSSGQIHWHPLRGPSGMRPRRLLRETRRSHRDRLRSSLRGQPHRRSQGARQGRNTLPSPDVRVGRTPKRFGPPGETSSEIWAARCARQRRERVDPKPKGASSGRATATSHERNGLLGGRKP